MIRQLMMYCYCIYYY